jgi:hypothetical protein
MGTFLLYNCIEESTLEGACQLWLNIPELQKRNDGWPDEVIHCKIPVRTIQDEADSHKSANTVSFTLIQRNISADVEPPLEPYVFKQTSNYRTSFKVLAWLPNVRIQMTTQSFVWWDAYCASLDSVASCHLREGLQRCNQALLAEGGLSKQVKLKMSQVQSCFRQGSGIPDVMKCNPVRHTLGSFLESAPAVTQSWSNTSTAICMHSEQPSFGWLRANFAARRNLQDALRLMRQDYLEKGIVWKRFGTSCLWARTATVSIKKGIPGKKSKDKQGSFLIMHADDEGRPASLSRSDCQNHCVWIASLDKCAFIL